MNFEKRKNYNALEAPFRQLVMQHVDEIRDMQKKGDTKGLQELEQKLLAQAQEKVKGEAEFKFTPAQVEAYTTIGGTPHLDGEYTVFGEVVEGMDVVDLIQQVATNEADRPIDDVVIKKMTVLDN